MNFTFYFDGLLFEENERRNCELLLTTRERRNMFLLQAETTFLRGLRILSRTLENFHASVLLRDILEFCQPRVVRLENSTSAR